MKARIVLSLILLATSSSVWAKDTFESALAQAAAEALGPAGGEGRIQAPIQGKTPVVELLRVLDDRKQDTASRLEAAYSLRAAVTTGDAEPKAVMDAYFRALHEAPGTDPKKVHFGVEVIDQLKHLARNVPAGTKEGTYAEEVMLYLVGSPHVPAIYRAHLLLSLPSLVSDGSIPFEQAASGIKNLARESENTSLYLRSAAVNTLGILLPLDKGTAVRDALLDLKRDVDLPQALRDLADKNLAPKKEG